MKEAIDLKTQNNNSSSELYSYSEELTLVCEKLFPGLDNYKGLAVFNKAVDAVRNTSTILSDDVINASEKYWQAMQNDNSDEMEAASTNEVHENYFYLRNQFSESEIREILDSVREDGIEKLLLEKIKVEQEETAELMDKENENIEKMENGIKSYFDNLGVVYPNKKLAKIVAIGKYQGMVIFSSTSEKAESLPAKGYMSPGLGAIYAKFDLDKQGYEYQKDNFVHLLTHERFHSLSAEYIPNINEVGEIESTPGFQLGFSKVLDGQEYASYSNINEGVTEYFARQVSLENGFEYNSIMYQENVESTEIVLNYLSQYLGPENLNNFLLTQYTKTEGLNNLMSVIEDAVGPYGLPLCDMFFSSPTMLKNFLHLVDERKSGRQSKSLELNIETLQRIKPPIDMDKFLESYPFVDLVTYIRDQDTLEYKKVPYKANL